MIKIQLVDDEPNILAALQRMLRSEDWDIQAFDDVHEALDALGTSEYAAIICDYKMPEIDGVTYLQFAKQRQPDAVRMMLSAHGDRQSMIHAINNAEIYRFLSKPWEDGEVENALKTAVDFYQLRRLNQQLVKKVQAQQNALERQQRELRRLEDEYPGITRVERDLDGSVILRDADYMDDNA